MKRVWILTLFAAEEIPSAMVTFVAMLMFLQMRIPVWEVTLLSAGLSLPWVLKSWARSMVKRSGHFSRWIHVCETLLTLALVVQAFIIKLGVWPMFAALFVISMLSAWHELLARMYYERMLWPRQQRMMNTVKAVTSQIAVVMTYGMMIIVVGVLEIYFRQKSMMYAWSLGCYMVAGVFLLLTLWHLLILQAPRHNESWHVNSVVGSMKAEMRVIERIRKQPHWWRHVAMLILMLMPQGLMFYSRTIFLMARPKLGGLGCSLQEVGFAQGTVGVIAFLTGISLGKYLLNYIPREKLFWPMTFCLGLSPAIYLMMSYEPPSALGVLCVATFQAQLLFGFGLNACLSPVHYISGERYRNTINLLYIPLVAACMFIPMAFSGWMLTQMDFQTFFLIDTLTAPIGWMLIKILKPSIINHES